MPHIEALPQPTSANLNTLAELDVSLNAKGTVHPGDGLYPRDGMDEVTQIETLLSEVTFPNQANVTVWASGMAAVRETVNFAAVHMAENGTRLGGAPTIARANELYSQALVFFAKERRKGVKIVGLDSGDEASVTQTIADKGADVLFAETVANTPGMPVLNIHNLLEQIRDVRKPPLVILDNTLPLSTGLDLGEILSPEDPVIVVESGTKNLMNNSELLGIAYSPNVELITALRKHKAHSGSVNSVGALPDIIRKLGLTLPGFHERNRAVFRSTGKIALALAEAQAELGSAADFFTTFPADPSHPNHAYTRTITPDGLPFVSPVVFLTATDWSETGAPTLVKRITEHPAIREQINEGEVHLGQSFGFPKARILYDRNAPNVRFAGGFEQADPAALATAIKEALADR